MSRGNCGHRFTPTRMSKSEVTTLNVREDVELPDISDVTSGRSIKKKGLVVPYNIKHQSYYPVTISSVFTLKTQKMCKTVHRSFIHNKPKLRNNPNVLQ